jgi:hypothetical protein
MANISTTYIEQFNIVLKKDSEKNSDMVEKLILQIWKENEKSDYNFTYDKPKFVKEQGKISLSKKSFAAGRWSYQNNIDSIFQSGDWVENKNLLIKLAELVDKIEYQYVEMEGGMVFCGRGSGELKPFLKNIEPLGVKKDFIYFNNEHDFEDWSYTPNSWYELGIYDCAEDIFDEMCYQIEEIQEKHKVTFTIEEIEEYAEMVETTSIDLLDNLYHEKVDKEFINFLKAKNLKNKLKFN